MSGGEQQMLAMGRALMAKPKLLLLDEPSMGLAPKLIKQIFDIVTEINSQGTTVLLVEQNAAQALKRVAPRLHPRDRRDRPRGHRQGARRTTRPSRPPTSAATSDARETVPADRTAAGYGPTDGASRPGSWRPVAAVGPLPPGEGIAVVSGG